jgi:hypothetical protein
VEFIARVKKGKIKVPPVFDVREGELIKVKLEKIRKEEEE